MVAFPTYALGTVSIAAAGTTLTGSGTIWSGVNARSGDTIFVDGVQNKISDVTDETHLELVLPAASALSGVSYVILQDSPLRFVGGQAMADVSSLIKVLNDKGLLWYLPDGYTTPSGGTGLPALTADDGQGILNITTKELWVMTGGSWVSAGLFSGFGAPAAYDSGTTYQPLDVVLSGGTVYLVTAETTGHAPPNTSYYSVIAPAGDAATVAVGTVTTGAGGSDAAVTNSGTSGAAVLDFTIPAGKSYGGTSTTSLAIGTGSKAFTTQSGLAYLNGARVRASSAADTSNWMEGVVTYSGTTLTINVSKTNGSGTFADWNLNIVGEPGAGDVSSANHLSEFSSDTAALGNLPYTDGIDTFPTPLLTRERNWMWITDTDQITGNGTSDDTTGVQNAVNKACDNRRRLLIPDDIVIRTTAPIVNPTDGRLNIQGAGCEPSQYMDQASDAVDLRGRGSWFFLDHSGIGFSLNGRPDSGTQVGSGRHRIYGIGTYRTQPTPGTGWTPNTDHDFDFDITQSGADIDDLCLLNPTRGLRAKTRGGQVNIGRITGQPLLIGIEFDNVYDVSGARKVHFWPFWSTDDDVVAYTMNNSDAIRLFRADGATFGEVFSFAMRDTFYIGNFSSSDPNNPAGTTYHFHADRIYSDQGTSAFHIDTDSDGFSGSIGSMVAEQNPLVTGNAHCVNLRGSNSRLHIDSLYANNADGSLVFCGLSGSQLQINAFNAGSYNRSAVGFPAVEANGSGSVVKIQQWTSYGSGGPMVTESSSGRVTGWSHAGTGTIASGNASLSVSHALGTTPRHVDVAFEDLSAQAIGSNLPRISSKDDTQFTIDIGVVATHDIPISWNVLK